MVFKNKLDMLITQMHSSNAALARAASLHPSLVSRFRTGSRIPSQNSIQLQALCKGLVLIAENGKKTDVLINICNLPADLTKSSLYEALYQWLSADNSMLRPERQHNKRNEEKKLRHKKNTQLKAFSEKLDILMNAFHVSNTRLARYLNVDASLISRYRTGMRTLSAENQLITHICTYFSTRAKEQQQEVDLLDILDLPANADSMNNLKLLFDHLYIWLTEKQDTSGNSVMDNLLEKLDAFQSELNITLLPPESVYITAGELQTVESFWGIDGIRQAVIRFLTLTAEQNTPRTLYLYSDQRMNWLTSDINFTKTWASLMLTILSKGNRIKIIHTVDRESNELYSAIEKWLPLYMSGQIEPYYCKRPKDSCFTHTMFIASDLCLINSSCIGGTEERAEYVLNTDTRNVEYFTEQFQSLLTYCNSLMQIYTSKTADQYMLRHAEFERQDGDIKALLPSLSLCTMPLDLLTNILDRSNVPSDARKKILLYNENRTKRFYRSLSGNMVTEFTTLPADEQLFANKISIDLPKFILEDPIYYTPGEYSEHIKNIIQVLTQNSNYHFCPLPASHLRNIQIIVKEGVGAIVVKNGSPTIAFTFNHPLMCNALNTYMDSLSSRSTRSSKSGTVAELLMKYII